MRCTFAPSEKPSTQFAGALSPTSPTRVAVCWLVAPSVNDAGKPVGRLAQRCQAGGRDADVQKRCRLGGPARRRRDLRHPRRRVDERAEEGPRAGRVDDLQDEVPRVIDAVALQDRALDVAVVERHDGGFARICCTVQG